MHVAEGTLQAYLDRELEPEHMAQIAAHVHGCDECRMRAKELSSRSALVRQALAALDPAPHEAIPPVPAAVARLRQAVAPRRAAPWIERLSELQRGAYMMFNKAYRPVWATLAAVLVVASLFSFAPVRAAAGQFLELFRVRKFAVIPINPSTLQNLDSADMQQRLAEVLSEDVTFVHKPGEPVPVASPEEASQKAGLSVRLPAALEAPQAIEVQDGAEMRYRINVARARTMLEMIGASGDQIPTGLDGQAVYVKIHPIVAAQFGTPEKWSLIQAISPIVDLPAEADVNALGEILLQLWGLSADEARQRAAQINWTSTLVIPLPVDVASYQEVTVEGSDGLALEEVRERSGARALTLLWQKDDVVYALSGQASLERALEIAHSLP